MPDSDSVVAGEVVSDAYDGPGDWLPPADAARRIGVSERTLWRRVTAGLYQKRVVAGKAQILVPASGSVPTTAALVEPDGPDTEESSAVTLRSLDLLDTLLRANGDTMERQVEQIADLHRRLGRAEAEADLLRAEVDRLRRPWWRRLLY